MTAFEAPTWRPTPFAAGFLDEIRAAAKAREAARTQED